MSASDLRHSAGKGPLRRERLLPLLWRHVSLAYYRRSARHARHVQRIGSEQSLPVAPLTDLLAVYLTDRLPARLVARLGTHGIFRLAKVLRALLSVCGALGQVGFVVLRSLFRAARALYRVFGRGGAVSPRSSPRFLRRSPAGNLNLSFGHGVTLCGYRCEADVLHCYFQRVANDVPPCEVFVHAYPERSSDAPVAADGQGRFLHLDHRPDPDVPVWPRGWVYHHEVRLAALPAGDYRIEIGLYDLHRRERLIIEENGRSSHDLGWLRVRGSRRMTPERAAHAGVTCGT